MKTRWWGASAALAMGLAATVGQAQQTDDPEGACTGAGESEIIRLLLCEVGLADEDLVEAAEMACGEVRPCGVWFWTEAADLPPEAPENHDGLTVEQITTSLGVYSAETATLVRIEKVTD